MFITTLIADRMEKRPVEENTPSLVQITLLKELAKQPIFLIRELLQRRLMVKALQLIQLNGPGPSFQGKASFSKFQKEAKQAIKRAGVSISSVDLQKILTGSSLVPFLTGTTSRRLYLTFSLIRPWLLLPRPRTLMRLYSPRSRGIALPQRPPSPTSSCHLVFESGESFYLFLDRSLACDSQ